MYVPLSPRPPHTRFRGSPAAAECVSHVWRRRRRYRRCRRRRRRRVTIVQVCRPNDRRRRRWRSWWGTQWVQPACIIYSNNCCRCTDAPCELHTQTHTHTHNDILYPKGCSPKTVVPSDCRCHRYGTRTYVYMIMRFGFVKNRYAVRARRRCRGGLAYYHTCGTHTFGLLLGTLSLLPPPTASPTPPPPPTRPS